MLRKTVKVLKILTIVLLIAIISCCTAPQKKVVSIDPQVLDLGAYTESGIHKAEGSLGVKMNHVLIFQDIQKINYSKVTPYLDNGYEVILNVQFNDTYPNQAAIANGAYDGYLSALADDIKKDGRPIWLRPLHEFNGHWYNWAVYYRAGNSTDNNSIQNFKNAWIHIVTFFRERNVPVKFQLDYNRQDGYDYTTPFSEFWPGDDYVDMVVITSYNRAYTDEWHSYWHGFDEDFGPAYDQAVNLTAKPIGIAEMGTTSYNGDKPEWIREAFYDVAVKYPRVTQMTWMLHNVKKANVTWDWDMNTAEDREAFAASAENFTGERAQSAKKIT